MCQEQLLDHKHHDEPFDEGRIAFECTYTGREPPELVDLFQISRSTTTLWSVLVLLGTSWYQEECLGTSWYQGQSVLVLLGTKTLCSLGIIMAYSLFKKLHSNCMFVFRGAYLSNRHDDGEE